MKRNLRQELTEAFGYQSYAEFRAKLKESNYVYPIVLSWKCIATGRRKLGSKCIFREGINEDPDVDTSYVSENFSYIRFKGDERIHRFLNPPDMVEAIKEFDAEGWTNCEDGDEFVLEAMTKARSMSYSQARREGIKNGTWEVTPRGPNAVKRQTQKHHFRPF